MFIVSTRDIGFNKKSVEYQKDTPLLVLDTNDCVVETYTGSECVKLYWKLPNLDGISVPGVDMVSGVYFGGNSVSLTTFDRILKGRVRCTTKNFPDGTIHSGVFIKNRLVLEAVLVNPKRITIYGESNVVLADIKLKYDIRELWELDFYWAEKIGEFYEVSLLLSMVMANPSAKSELFLKAVIDDDNFIGIYKVEGDASSCKLPSAQNIPSSVVARLSLM